jgi:ABC-2 type transport system permease protein
MSPPPFITTVLARHDVDARQLATLVGVYLKQDLRGGRAFMQFNAREYVRSNVALLALLGMYVFTGFLMGMMVFFTDIDALHFSIIIHTFTLLIVALAILAESGNVIFNESEADILGHLPISSRTYFAAKVLNLFLFTSLLATAANLFPAIFGAWSVGANFLFLPAHALSSLLDALLATALIVTSYGLLMRLVGRERFDSIIAYSQIVLVLVFMFGFQILPRVMDINFMQLARGFRWYYLLFPPAWFAGMTLVLMGKLHLYALALAGAGLTALAVLGRFAVRKVGSDYSSFVVKLTYREGARAGRGVEASATVPATRRGLAGWLKGVWLSRPAERASFDLVSVYLRRNREVKVRLYPSLAYFVFVPLLAVFSEGLPDPFKARGLSQYSLMGALMICYVGLTAVEVLRFSGHHEAAYIFRVAPVARLGDVHSGFRKAIMTWVALPGFGVLFVLYAVLWRNPLHAALLLAPWVIITPAVLMLGFLFRESLPLSRKYQKGQQTTRNLLLFLVCVALLSLFGGLQAIAIRGRVPVMKITFPYELFIGVSVLISAAFYFALRALSRETRVIQPSDAAAP